MMGRPTPTPIYTIGANLAGGYRSSPIRQRSGAEASEAYYGENQPRHGRPICRELASRVHGRVYFGKIGFLVTPFPSRWHSGHMPIVETDMPTKTDEFEALIREHQMHIWQYLRFLGARNSEADDLTQETFLALYRSLENGSFQIHSSAQSRGYLRTVARNQLLMLRRRMGKELDTVQLDVAGSVWAQAIDSRVTDEHPDGVESFLSQLKQCRDNLTGRARQAITWFYQDELSREAIAERMNMKPQGVKTLLRRTRSRLRECVQRGVNQ